MADDLKIVIRAILNEKQIRTDAENITGVEIPGRIVIDKDDIKKQIDSIAGESSRFSNKYKIKFGVDRADFVKQAHDAGVQAKKEIEKAVGSSGTIDIKPKISTNAATALRKELDKVGFDQPSIQAATKGLEEQKIKVKEIATSYQSVADAQTGLQSITIKGIDAQQRQVTLVQRFDKASQDLEKTQIRVVAKLNEQGEIIATMPTKLRPKDTETIRAEEVEVLNRFISNINQAKMYIGEMKTTADALKVSLSNAFAEPELKAYQNQLGIAKQQFMALKAEAARLAALPVNTIDKNTGVLNQTLGFKGMDGQTAGVTDLRNEINLLIGEYGRLKISMDGLDPSSAEFQTLATQVDALDVRFKSATKAAEIFNDSFASKSKMAGVSELINKAKSSLDELEVKWSKFKGNPALVAEFQKLRDSAQQLDATNLQNFNKQLGAFKANVRAAGADTRNFGDEIKNALAKFGIWITAGTILMQGIRGLRQMVDSVKELDAAMVEFNKVADLSNSQLDKFIDRAFDAGKALARTGTEVLAASAIWKQAGYTVEESLQLASASLMTQNVGDGIESAAQASSVLVAALKGFQLPAQAAESVLDALNNTSNNNAVGFAALADGVQRASGVMRQSGTTMAETIGLLTGGFESLRNMEKVSTGLITLSMRLRGVNEEGEAIDGLIPKLQATFKEIANVDIQDQNGDLRSSYDILSDLAGAWDTLSSKQKQYIGEKAAGIRQISVFNAIIDNFKSVRKATDDAANSAGSARIENEKFLDSIQGRLNNLTSAFQAFSASTINSGLIKFIVDAATAIVSLIDKIGLLPAVLFGLNAYGKLFADTKILKAISAFGDYTAKGAKKLFELGRIALISKGSIRAFRDGVAEAGIAVNGTKLAIAGLIVAYTAIKLGFDAYTKGLEDQKQKAKELSDTWKETSETLKTSKDAIADIGSEFEKLGDGVNSFGKNISLTADEFSRYNQITNQIAGMFPELVSGYDEQGNAILGVKGNVEELTAAYEKQRAAAYDAILQGAGTVFGQSKGVASNSSDLFGIADTGTFQQIEMTRDLLKEMSRMKADGKYSFEAPLGAIRPGDAARSGKNAFQDVQVGAGVTFGGSGDFGLYSVDPKQLDSNIKQLSAYERTLVAKSKSAAREVTPIIEAYLYGDENFASLSEDGQNLIKNVVGSLDPEYIFKHDNVSGLMDSVFTDIMGTVGDNPAILEKSIATITSSDEFRKGKISVDAYRSSITQLETELANAGVKNDIASSIVDMATVKDIDSLVSNVQNKLSDEFDGKVGSMSLQDLRLASTLEVPEGVLLTWDELQERISATKNILTSLTLTEQVAAIKTAAETANTAFEEGAYYGSISKEQYDKLAAAGDEYAATVDSTNGYLTVNKQKLDALIASKQEEARAQLAFNKAQSLADYEKNSIQLATQKDALDALALSTEYTAEEKEKYADILNEQNDALETSQEYLRAEIKAYDVLASELNYATSAYKRWLDAKNAPEAGDGYDELSNVRKAIEEGLESGKTGTTKYKAAEALLIPEEISAQGKEAVQKYMKSMGKYLTEDSTGLQKYIDDLYGAGFLTQDDSGTYFTTQKANIQDIAKELNITEEAARLMFAALKDYDWDISIPDSAFDSSAAITKFDEATAKWEEAKAYVEKLVKENASDVEIAAAKAAESEAKRLQDEASVAVTQVDTGASLEEQLKAQIAAYQAAIAELGAIGVPATLLLNSGNEAANLQTQLDAILAAQAIIAKATVELDDAALKEQLAALQSPTNPDGTAKTPIQITIDAYLSDLYTAALAKVEEDKNQTGTVTIGGEASQFDNKIAEIEGGTYGATVVIDGNTDPLDTKLTTVEERLAALQAKFDESDPNDDSPPLSVQYGGTNGITSPEEILDFWEGSNQPNNGISQSDASSQLAEAESLMSGVAEAAAAAAAEAEKLAKIIEEFESKRDTVGFGPTKEEIQAAAAEEQRISNLKAVAEAGIEIPVVTSGLEEVTNAIDAVVEKPRTITIPIKTVSPGGVVPVNEEYAKGTKRAKKGIALTGEKGVETVFDKDGFYTVGNDGPELVNLKGGEEILTHNETKKLLGGKKKRISGQAFEGGTLWDILVKASGKGIGGTKPKSKSKSSKDTKDDSATKSLFDWIPRLLDRLRKQTEKLIEQSESLVSYTAQNAKLDQALKNNTANIKSAQSSYTRYMKEASKSGKGLSSSLIKKIQNGSVSIESYSGKTRERIEEYQKWYDLAQGTLDTVTELKEQQRELSLLKLDNVQKYYENRIGQNAGEVSLAESGIALKEETGREVTADDYSDIISATSNQLALLLEQKVAYEKEFNKLVANGTIKEGSDDWYEYTGNLNDMDVAINEASTSLDEFRDIVSNIEVKNLDIAMKYLNTVQSTLESLQGLREAQGDTLTPDDYEQLIDIGMQQIETLEAQNDVLREQQDGLDVLSDEYQEIQDQIDGNLGSIWDIKTEQENWNDAIIDLDIQKLQEVNEEYDKQYRTMEAIENLEKAKQRRNLVYKEGQGFVYEADQGAIKDAQNEYDDVLFDNLIDTLEGLKDDNNVYDGAGNLIGTPSTAFDGVDFTSYLGSIASGLENSSLLADAIANIDLSAIGGTGAGTNTVTFTGNFILNGVNDVEGLAEAISVQLPSYIQQLWFSNTNG